MYKLLRTLGALAVITTLIASSSLVAAGEQGRGNSAKPSQSALGIRDLPESGNYGVGVTPAIYLINFLLLYISSPRDAANMPAYRTPIPLELTECLDENSTGCSYFEYARFFDDRAFRAKAIRDRKCSLPDSCQTTPEWTALAPPVATKLEQINEALGLERADEIATSLGIEKDMILTDRELLCTTTAQPSDDQETIDNKATMLACLNNLSNSTGATNIPLSSYGLALTDPMTNPSAPPGAPEGNAQSLCAPRAPCLVFNDLFVGPLQKVAVSCGWEQKLDRMLEAAPFGGIFNDAMTCQDGARDRNDACTVEPNCS
jgi:hypothetical protein